MQMGFSVLLYWRDGVQRVSYCTKDGVQKVSYCTRDMWSIERVTALIVELIRRVTGLE